jgi:hypothetical protein
MANLPRRKFVEREKVKVNELEVNPFGYRKEQNLSFHRVLGPILTGSFIVP